MKHPKNLHALSAIEIPGDTLPTEFRIFAFGENASTKGTFLFDEASAQSVMARYAERGIELHFDYEHDLVHPAPGPKPAAGWFVPEVRADGLYAANIRWTPQATKFLTEKEYRYFSPLFRADDSGRVIELWNVALTNDPALLGAAQIVAASDHSTPAESQAEEPIMKNLLKALGVAETATETDAITALTTREAPLTELTTLTDKQTHAEALAVVRAWQQSAEQVTTLTNRVQELEAAAEKKERDALIEKGLTDKQLTPAMRTWAEGQTVEALKAYLSVAPKIAALAASSVKEPGTAAKHNGKTWDEMSNVEKHNLAVTDPDTYTALKAAKGK